CRGLVGISHGVLLDQCAGRATAVAVKVQGKCSRRAGVASTTSSEGAGAPPIDPANRIATGQKRKLVGRLCISVAGVCIIVIVLVRSAVVIDRAGVCPSRAQQTCGKRQDENSVLFHVHGAAPVHSTENSSNSCATAEYQTIPIRCDLELR